MHAAGVPCPKPMMLRSHVVSNDTTATTTLVLLCYSITATTTLVLLCYSITATITLVLLYCYSITATTTLVLLYYSITATTTDTASCITITSRRLVLLLLYPNTDRNSAATGTTVTSISLISPPTLAYYPSPRTLIDPITDSSKLHTATNTSRTLPLILVYHPH